jgi:hypothetical protein
VGGRFIYVSTLARMIYVPFVLDASRSMPHAAPTPITTRCATELLRRPEPASQRLVGMLHGHLKTRTLSRIFL